MLLGRNPQPQPGEEDAQLIKIADETRTVSKLHLAIGVDRGRAVRGGPGLDQRLDGDHPGRGVPPLPPGERSTSSAGSIVSMGDHWLRSRQRLTSATVGRYRSRAVLLSDRDIRAEVAAGRIGLEPYSADLVQPSSIDVRLDRYFRVFENHRYPHIDPALEQSELTRPVQPEAEEPFILHPGEFALGSIYEVVTLPDDIAARVEGSRRWAGSGC